jgi:hypothetical protein
MAFDVGHTPDVASGSQSFIFWSLPFPTGSTADIFWSRDADMTYGHASLWSSYYVRGSASYLGEFTPANAMGPQDLTQTDVINGSILMGLSVLGNSTAANVDPDWTGAMLEDDRVRLNFSGARIDHLMGSASKIKAPGGTLVFGAENTPNGIAPAVLWTIWR